MNAAMILERKGDQVATARPNLKIGDAARQMAERDFGSLVVCDPFGQVIGLLAERDIVRGLAQPGQAVFELPVSALMRENVVVCGPADDLPRLMSLMTRHRVRHLPVVVGRRLRGLVSIGDVVRHRLEETELEVNVLRDYARSRLSVA